MLLISCNLQKILDAQESKNAEFDESVYVRCTWGVSVFVVPLQYEGDEAYDPWLLSARSRVSLANQPTCAAAQFPPEVMVVESLALAGTEPPPDTLT